MYSQSSLQQHSLQQQHSLKRHFDRNEMVSLFKICILYNSKVSLTAKYSGTDDVIVKRVHCIKIPPLHVQQTLQNPKQKHDHAELLSLAPLKHEDNLRLCV